MKRVVIKRIGLTLLFFGTVMSLIMANIPATTAASFTDIETAAGNSFQAWSASLWQQTTRTDFEAGVRVQVDTSSSAGNIMLGLKSDWYQTSWNRRVPVNINNAGVSLTDYQVRVNVTFDADMQPDFDDIRFTDSNGLTLLPYWRESYTASSSAIFWVKISSVPSGTKAIYMYYGNPGVTTASNGTATFVFFDDFSGNLSKWNIHISTAIAITASYGNPAPCLEISGGYMDDYPYGLGIIGSDATYNNFQDGIIEADVYPATDGLPEIIFRGNYYDNTGYKGRWDTRDDWETPWMTPPYDNWGGFGDDVERFGIADQWQKTKLVITSSTFEIYSNDTLMSTVTDDMYSGPGEIGLCNHYGDYSRFDNVRVRKYASPEPTASVGAEQGPYVLTGTIASQVLDTGITGTIWDGLFWDETLMANTDITLEVRASNTSFNAGDANPPWNAVGRTSPVISGLPSGRYIQWRATLTTTNTANTPTLNEVRVYYY